MSTAETPADQKETETWTCARCDVPLQSGKVTVAYLGNFFPVELLRCPNCGRNLPRVHPRLNPDLPWLRGMLHVLIVAEEAFRHASGGGIRERIGTHTK